MAYQSILLRTILEVTLKEIKCFRDNNYYVTDNAFNITKAVQIYNYITCSGHNLNLISKHSFEGNTNLKNLVNAIKKIVENIRKKKVLKEFSIFIPQSVHTRFNSVYFMMDSFASNYQTIKNHSRNNNDQFYSELILIC